MTRLGLVLLLLLAPPYALERDRIAAGSAEGPGQAAVRQQPPPRAIPPLRVPVAGREEASPPRDDTVPPLLRVSLSEGSPSRVEPPPPARMSSLPPERVEALLALLPDAPGSSSGPQPAGAEPRPPQTEGAPGRGGARGEEARPLRVLSVVPSGETELAPSVTVVFSEPVVSLGTDGEPLSEPPPAELAPQPPGSWRWLDPRTLRFEPDRGRLPGATSFRLRVPGGTASVSGARLEAPFEARFHTAGARVLGGYPNVLGGPGEGLARPQPAVLLVFDQQVEPAAVLASARLEADGAMVPLRLAGVAELEGEEPGVAEAAQAAGEGLWVALRPTRPLPEDAEAVLRLGPDLASGEGPRPARRDQELRFRVAGAFEVRGHSCASEEGRCPALGHWRVHLSNPLDTVQALPDLVRLEPEVRDLRVLALQRDLVLLGELRPHTTYRLELDPELRDRFGTRLGPTPAIDGYIGAPQSFVQLPGAPFLTLDPAAAGRVELRVRAVSDVEVDLYRVRPEEWPRFRDNRHLRRHPEREPWVPAGDPAARLTLRAPHGGRGFSTLQVDLSEALGDVAGHVLLVARGRSPDGGFPDRLPPGFPGHLQTAAWIQAASFALGAAWTPAELTGWALTLDDRSPLEGVPVRLSGGGPVAVTDAAGLARIPLEPRSDSLLVAEWRDEVVLLPATGPGASWAGDPSYPAPRWFVVTDRGLYQPGEDVSIHGWIREPVDGPGAGLGFPERVDSVRYIVRSPQRQTIAEGTAPVSASGTFHVTEPLPAEAGSGHAVAELVAVSGREEVSGWTHRKMLRVEQFRRPEYEVSLDVGPGPYLPGDLVEATASASYYDGAPLPGAPVSWRVTASRGWWAPPGWSSWRFGDHARDAARPQGSAVPASLASSTDGRGRHALRIATGTPRSSLPVHLGLGAEVRDLDRQAGSAGGSVLVHPAAVAVGLRPDRHWLQVDETLVVEVAAVDLEGAPEPGVLPVVVAEMEPAGDRPGGAAPRAVPVSCGAGGPVEVGERTAHPLRCRIVPPVHGRLRVEARVVDGRGRESLTRMHVSVFGGPRLLASSGPVQGVRLLPDRTAYAAGDTARVAVEVPVYPMEGLLILSRSGAPAVRPLRVEGPGHVESIALDSGDVGGVLLQLRLNPANGGVGLLQTAARLNVDSDGRRLRVHVQPGRDRVEPGDSVTLDVRVEDAAGTAAAGGEVTLWVVDEAVLSLGGYRLPDPVSGLYGPDRRHVPRVLLPHGTVRWLRRPLGPGVLSAEVVDAATGSGPGRLVARLAGTGRETTLRQGRLVMRDVPPGPHRLVLLREGVVVGERTVDVPAGGLDLGVLALPLDPVRAEGLLMRGSGTGLALASAVAVEEAARMSGPPGIEIPAPVEAELAGLPPASPVVDLRRLFSALAASEEDVPLDGEGRARVTVRLPDTMTRYRIFAVATHRATRFGTAESALTAARDLVVRAAPPRVLRPGDRPELPVTLLNASDTGLEVDVVGRAGGRGVRGTRGFRVLLPAGGRTELRVPAEVQEPGDAVLDVVAVARPDAPYTTGSASPAEPAAGLTDALRVPLRVRPALAPRTASLHRTLRADERLRLPVARPPRARRGYGSVDVGLSPSLLHPLVDVIGHLCLDPVFLPEATIARVLGLGALDAALESLRSPHTVEPDELRALVRSDLDRLVAWLEPYAYGHTYRAPGSEWLSSLDRVHAAHALEVARQAGYAVAERTAARLGHEVRRVWEREHDRLSTGPAARAGWEWATAAYALHVGVRVASIPMGRGHAAETWLESLDPADLPAEVLAWLLAPAAAHPEGDRLRAAFLRELENRARTTGATATFPRGERTFAATPELDVRRLVQASDRRTDAAVLAVLVEEEPDHPLIPALVRGLLGHRDGSPAGGAHENGWVLLALGRYAAAHEQEEVDLEARVAWVGGDGVGAGADTASSGAGTVPSGAERVRLATGRGGAGWLPVRSGAPPVGASFPAPAPGEAATLEVQTRGRGTLHVRAAVRYSPEVTPDLPAEERGFFVSRRYEAVDDSDDVRLDPDGTWRIRAGARVRVRLTLTAPERRYRVQLRDPLPGGLEAVNPGLRGTGFSDDPDPAAEPDIPRAGVMLPLAATPWNGPFGWEWTDLLFRWRADLHGWAAHEELRDDRMDAYAPYLPAGTYPTTYLVRATTPGAFLAPPPRIEETDHPETFGQGAADRVVVEVR